VFDYINLLFYTMYSDMFRPLRSHLQAEHITGCVYICVYIYIYIVLYNAAKMYEIPFTLIYKIIDKILLKCENVIKFMNT